jgi:hypothetical protein
MDFSMIPLQGRNNLAGRSLFCFEVILFEFYFHLAHIYCAGSIGEKYPGYPLPDIAAGINNKNQVFLKENASKVRNEIY